MGACNAVNPIRMLKSGWLSVFRLKDPLNEFPVSEVPTARIAMPIKNVAIIHNLRN